MPIEDASDLHEWEEEFHNDQEFMEEFMRICNNPEVSESDEDTPDSHDLHIGMQLLMDCGVMN